jgi:tRNA modification GTPase
VKLRMWSKASVSVRRFEKIEQSQVVLYLFESLKFKVQSSEYIVEIEKVKNQFPLKPLVVVINKLNYWPITKLEIKNNSNHWMWFSKWYLPNKTSVSKNKLLSFVNTGALRNNETIVTNTRHYDSLLKALEEVTKVKYGLETNLPSDLMARY